MRRVGRCSPPRRSPDRPAGRRRRSPACRYSRPGRSPRRRSPRCRARRARDWCCPAPGSSRSTGSRGAGGAVGSASVARRRRSSRSRRRRCGRVTGVVGRRASVATSRYRSAAMAAALAASAQSPEGALFMRMSPDAWGAMKQNARSAAFLPSAGQRGAAALTLHAIVGHGARAARIILRRRLRRRPRVGGDAGAAHLRRLVEARRRLRRIRDHRRAARVGLRRGIVRRGRSSARPAVRARRRRAAASVGLRGPEPWPRRSRRARRRKAPFSSNHPPCWPRPNDAHAQRSPAMANQRGGRDQVLRLAARLARRVGVQRVAGGAHGADQVGAGRRR